MAKSHTVLKVFIASPGDVCQEREVLTNVVSEFNVTWGDRQGVRLEVVKWETHSHPGFGEDAQDVINRQIGDEYDIFLGIMWGRYGTATGRGESGTEEEFNRAYDRLLNGDRVQVMFYFKDAGIPPSKLDGDQVLKIHAFKKRLAEECGGLFDVFETAEDFQTKVRIHLSKVVQDWLDANANAIDSKAVLKDDEGRAEMYNPLANLAALDDHDADEGILDLVDRGCDAMEEVVQIVSRMTSATVDLGEKFGQRTREAEAIRDATDRNSARRVANGAANDLEVFVKRMAVEIPEFYKQHSIFTDSFGSLSLSVEGELNDSVGDVESALEKIQEYRNEMSRSSGSLEYLQQSIYGMPRMTTVFNRSRRRAVAVMDDLLTQLRIASSQTRDIEKLLRRLLGSNFDRAQ
ncbi:hypothetical protein Pla108_25700 [Botrimarina colliarenosi]|uniref:DUF4062 domain-containing protein n=1 Tax=Botrimarina colliarenosi TaxID=2528001 RepID=A0A5C6ABI6_9BACT|nr:DUF4062 domain-containing protein [Botrimarina colliarenosi]TWT96796.1 hypothetical protein Pla108_25700 [Botrimarina colliarenosi]